MIVRPICVTILLLALAGCAAPRGHMPEEAGLPSAAEDGPPPAAMAAREIDVVALRLALHDAAGRGHLPLTYDDVWDALDRTDEDPENPANVILLYTGRSHPKADKDSTALNPETPTNQSWNREHVWPRSHGLPDEDDLAHNDLHHLKPADRTVNSSRGNKDFDAGGEPHHEAVGNNADRDSFEPRDAVKGDIARMLFYMDVRYGGAPDGNDLELVDRTTDGERTTLGRLCTLLRWHDLDPVEPSSGGGTSASSSCRATIIPSSKTRCWPRHCSVCSARLPRSADDRGPCPRVLPEEIAAGREAAAA
jgi:endonuclease I